MWFLNNLIISIWVNSLNLSQDPWLPNFWVKTNFNKFNLYRKKNHTYINWIFGTKNISYIFIRWTSTEAYVYCATIKNMEGEPFIFKWLIVHSKHEKPTICTHQWRIKSIIHNTKNNIMSIWNVCKQTMHVKHRSPSLAMIDIYYFMMCNVYFVEEHTLKKSHVYLYALHLYVAA